jgi:hypothetical protein
MPAMAQAGFREFLPSANQALLDLEEATDCGQTGAEPREA